MTLQLTVFFLNLQSIDKWANAKSPRIYLFVDIEHFFPPAVPVLLDDFDVSYSNHGNFVVEMRNRPATPLIRHILHRKLSSEDAYDISCRHVLTQDEIASILSSEPGRIYGHLISFETALDIMNRFLGLHVREKSVNTQSLAAIGTRVFDMNQRLKRLEASSQQRAQAVESAVKAIQTDVREILRLLSHRDDVLSAKATVVEATSSLSDPPPPQAEVPSQDSTSVDDGAPSCFSSLTGANPAAPSRTVGERIEDLLGQKELDDDGGAGVSPVARPAVEVLMDWVDGHAVAGGGGGDDHGATVGEWGEAATDGARVDACATPSRGRDDAAALGAAQSDDVEVLVEGAMRPSVRWIQFRSTRPTIMLT